MNQIITVYSSAPLTTKLACAFQGLSRQGTHVEVRPLAELPTGPRPARRRSSLLDERHALCLQLATIGHRLDLIESGRLVPGAGEEPGLRAERDSLQARLRGVEGALRPAPAS